MRCGMATIGLDIFDFFGDLRTTEDFQVSSGLQPEGASMPVLDSEHYTQCCGPCVGSSENQHLSES